jgi:tetratricopeptide (TPR) repeat protein
MATRTAWTLCAAAALLALTGCGGDANPGGGSLDAQYQQALQASDPTLRVSQLLTVAGKQNDAHDMAGAQRSLASAAESAKTISDAKGRAAASNRVASALARMNRPGEAKKLLREVSKAAEQIDEPEARITALTRMAYTYGKYANDLDVATAYLQTCEEAAEQVARPEGQVESMLEIAYVYYGLESSDRMQALLDRALQTARGLEDTRKQADALASAGAMLHKMKRAEEAKAVFQEAQSTSGQIADPLSRGYALIHLGKQLDASGLKSAAQKILQQAEQAADQVQDQSMRTPLMDAIYAARRGL